MSHANTDVVDGYWALSSKMYFRSFQELEVVR